MRVFLFAVLAALLLSSCRTVEYVKVPEVRTDTLIITKQQRDSIWMHDSVHVRDKGDTVLIDRWRTKYIYKQVTDTTYISKVDSIPVPYPVTEYVEKKLNLWQRLRLHLGNIMLALMGGAVLYGVAKLYLKFKF